MSSLARAACVAAAFLSLLLGPGASRAEVVPGKLKYALLRASAESVVTDDTVALLFLEFFALRGKPGCVLVRYGGELSGSDFNASGHVVAEFKVVIGEVEVEPYPRVHEVGTNVFPQVVSFSAFVCGVPPGESGVAVTVRAQEEGDTVSVLRRTLEVWTERPVLAFQPAATSPALARNKTAAPPGLLKAKRSFVAYADDAVTDADAPALLFDENVILKGKSSCILVRYSGELQVDDGNEDNDVLLEFETSIGLGAPVYRLHDPTASEQSQQVGFSAFSCGLPPGPYDIRLQVVSAGENDQVEVRTRTLEVFTGSGVAAPPVE